MTTNSAASAVGTLAICAVCEYCRRQTGWTMRPVCFAAVGLVLFLVPDAQAEDAYKWHGDWAADYEYNKAATYLNDDGDEGVFAVVCDPDDGSFNLSFWLPVVSPEAQYAERTALAFSSGADFIFLEAELYSPGGGGGYYLNPESPLVEAEIVPRIVSANRLVIGIGASDGASYQVIDAQPFSAKGSKAAITDMIAHCRS